MRIYLSPSSQTWNEWGVDKEHRLLLATNEAAQMQAFTFILKEHLERAGHTVYLYKDAASETKDNDQKINERVAESNTLGIDLHIALHSNATEGATPGPQMLINPNNATKETNLLSKLIFDELYAEYLLGGGTSNPRGIQKDDKIYELQAIKTTLAFVEIAFHDNAYDIDWMMNNWDKIAAAITRGVNKYAYEVDPAQTAEYIINRIKKLEGFLNFPVSAPEKQRIEEELAELNDLKKLLGITSSSVQSQPNKVASQQKTSSTFVSNLNTPPSSREDSILNEINSLIAKISSEQPKITIRQEVYRPDELSPEEQYFKDKDLAQRLLNIR